MDIKGKIFLIERDGLPDMEDLSGQVLFFYDGCLVNGWPLDELDEYGRNYWEANSDVGKFGKFANVTQYLVLEKPVWDYVKYKSRYLSVTNEGKVIEGIHIGTEYKHHIDLVENLQSIGIEGGLSDMNSPSVIEKEKLHWSDLMPEIKHGYYLWDDKGGLVWRANLIPGMMFNLACRDIFGNSFLINIQKWEYFNFQKNQWRPIIQELREGETIELKIKK